VTPSIFAQLIFNGIAIGLVYVFMASGFNLILSVTGIFFITFGMFYALGAYWTWYLVQQLHLPFFAGVAVATLSTAIGGVILYIVVIRRIRIGEQGMLRVLIASIMLVTLLTQFVLIVFGTSPRGIPPVFEQTWRVWGVVIGLDRVAVIAISVFILLALHFFLNKTRIGRGMRTVAFNPDVAALLGVNSEKVFLVTIGVGLGLVGFAGSLMAPILGVDITMGQAGFVVLLVIILGGIGSMVGSILSGILLGIVVAFGQFYFSAGVGQMIFFLVVGIFFFFRPGGLFGQPPPDPVGGVASMTAAKIKLKGGKRSWIVPVAAVALAIVLPLVIRNSYYQHLMILIVIFAVTGMTFTFGMRSGMINVAAAAFWGIGAYATGILMIKVGLTFWQALPLALVISFVLALILGAVICRFAGMSGMMFGIVFASIVPLVFSTFELFGKQSGLTSIPGVGNLGALHFGSKISYYYLILAFALVSVVIMLAFTKAWTGRAWLGLGSSQKLAESVGIDPFGYRVINFAIMSVIPALLGTAYGCYLGAIQPVTFGPFIGINFQIVAFVGGLGYIVAGPIVGALFMTLLPEALRAAGRFEPIITACIIIIVIMFMPAGIIGSQDKRILAGWRWVGRRLGSPLGWGRLDMKQPPNAVPAAITRESTRAVAAANEEGAE
jgi:branched-subunit amino acid ABC-type transport system permease component